MRTTKFKFILSVLSIVGISLIILCACLYVGFQFLLESSYVNYFEGLSLSDSKHTTVDMWTSSSYAVIFKIMVINPTGLASRFVDGPTLLGMNSSMLSLVVEVLILLMIVGVILILINFIMNFVIGNFTLNGYNRRINNIKTKIWEEIDRCNLPNDIVTVDDVNGVPNDYEFYGGQTVFIDEEQSVI